MTIKACTHHSWIRPVSLKIYGVAKLLFLAKTKDFKHSPSHKQAEHAYKALLPLALIFDVVFPLLHGIPPSLEVLETLRTGKVGHDFHTSHWTDSGKTFRVIAAEEVSDGDEPVSRQTHLPRQIGSEKAFDVFGVVEKVLEALGCAEEENIVIVGDNAIDQIEPSQFRTLRFGFHGRRYIRYAEKPQKKLDKVVLRLDERGLDHALT